MTRAAARALTLHRRRWGSEPEVAARAPGRVNLSGEHTDYNDGFTLPMALPFDTVVALSSAGDPATGPVDVDSEGFGRVTLDPTGKPVAGWARHVAGVVALLAEAGIPAGGWRAAIASDIPAGASLSSSAAVEVALITALVARAGATAAWPPLDVARLGQRVENEVVGLPSGIMDQLISAGAVAGHASLMDCRALTLDPRPLPAGVTVAVLDTGTRRVLADAAYAERRAACERAAAALGVPALRDADPAAVATLADPVDRRRARHVVDENTRTLEAAEALSAGDMERFGRLMVASHESLRRDYEVSGPALDHMVAVALDGPGCLGARMTGGGFAGCAVALVDTSAAEAFARHVAERYRFGDHRATVWPCHPAGGAGLLDLGPSSG